MAAIDFPTSPVNGQVFGNYTYDGTVGVWRATTNATPGLPAGAIMQWAGNIAPNNWLICDGSAVSRTTYASLFAAIGTSYGAGDGSTTFNIPDLRGRVPVGKNSGTFATLGATGGAESVTLTANQSGLRDHTHIMRAATSASVAGMDDGYARGIAADGSFRTGTIKGLTGSTGGSNYYGSADISQTALEAHTNLQPYQVVNYIIKTSAGATLGDSELATRVGAVETLKSPINSPTFTGTVVLPSTTSIGNVSSTELGYLDGVTSAIQTQIDGKASLTGASFTGTVSTTGNFDAAGKVIGTTAPNAGSDGGVAVKAPASGSQTSGYLQFVNNAYTTQYGAISASPAGVMSLSATQVSLPSKTYAPGAIVQVAYADTGPNKYTIAAQDITAITGLSISFTPKFSNSRIILQAYIQSDQYYVSTFGFLKNGSVLASNTNTNSAGSISTNYHGDSGTNGNMWTGSYMYTDVPGTTSAITYAAAGCSSWGGTIQTLQINDRASNDMRSISSLIIMEIAQ